jgi:hypothetical protein
MSLETFVSERKKTLEQQLAESELELLRLEQRMRYLQQVIGEVRTALSMLEECVAYQQGKHPNYAPSAQEAACLSPNGTVPLPVP